MIKYECWFFGMTGNFLVTLLLSACVTGPKQEKSTGVADALNWENYDETGTVLGVPILHHKSRETHIRGRLQLEDALQIMPNTTEIRLIKNGRIISEASANQELFELHGNFPNGDYTLEALANCFTGDANIKVNSYELKDALIMLHHRHCDNTPATPDRVDLK
jgi:hypothetical protein